MRDGITAQRNVRFCLARGAMRIDHRIERPNFRPEFRQSSAGRA
jgi:hypothetical protein